MAAELVADGHEVRTLQRRPSKVAGATDVLGSVTRPADVARAIDGAEGVVHLAAKVSLAGAPDEFRAVNVEGTRSLLDAAERAGVSRFVQVSSPSVAYAGSALAGVGAEPASPQRARGDYARTKAEGELLALDRDSETMASSRSARTWCGARETSSSSAASSSGRAVDGCRCSTGGPRSSTRRTSTMRPPGSRRRCTVRTKRTARRTCSRTASLARSGEILAGICLAAGVRPPRWSVPAGLGRAAGSAIERVWAIRPGTDEPPMTRFLAEQLSTAHWFDQRDTRRALAWAPTVSIDEGLRRLAAGYGQGLAPSE